MKRECKTIKLDKTAPRLSYGWVAFLLSACGGGVGTKFDTNNPPTGPTVPTEGHSGRVIDGYIEGARVFADANNNLLFDTSENYAITNSQGVFSGLTTADTVTLVVDNYAGTARDTSTGFGIGFTMAAPSGYEVITPVTTLVFGLMERGYSQEQAEQTLAEVLGISKEIDLQTFDPFDNLLSNNVSNSDLELAQNYQLSAMKIANIFMVRDGDYTNDTDRDFGAFLDKFASAIDSKASTGTTFNFSNITDLRMVVNEISNAQVIDLANANSATSYKEILDSQLLRVSGALDGTIDVKAGASEQLIAVEIDGSFSNGAQYSLTIDGEESSIISTDIVSVGKNVAVFRFSKSQIDELGTGSVNISVRNETTGEALSLITEFEAIQPAATTSTGGGGVSTPRVVVSDDGIVADGYISGARVFRDENENETFDVGEKFVITDANGAFTGLGGSASKPIVADGNNGAAVDTSTGVTFNSVLSAPAGSKVVNPITTVINELMQDTDPATIASITNADGEIDVKLASDKVAKAFGLTSGDSFSVDLTKFDPIENKVYVEEGETAPTVAANLATVTQGVATFIANLVVSGANEQGGSADALAASTKTIISNLKNVVKDKATSGTAFKFDDQNDILSALGSDFSASSPTLEKLKTSYDGFEPAVLSASDLSDTQKAKLANFDGDKLIEKQLLSQSEFGDGILTTAEAANGASLVVGPTDAAQTVTATVKITNDDANISIFKQVDFANAKYASVSLSAADLTKLGGGTISVEVKDAANLTSSTWSTSSASRIYDNFSSKAYFHKDITPVLNFGSKIFKTVSNEQVKINKGDTSSLEINGTLEIDLGGATLPTGVKLKNLVGGLDTVTDDTGRTVIIEVLDDSGSLAFLVNGKVTPLTGATNANESSEAKGTFNWSASIDATDKSVHDDTIAFSSLADGTYSVKVSFTDAYGTVSSDSGATFSNLIIDRSLPEVSISASDTAVNIVDAQTTFTVNFSKEIASTSIDYDLIKFTDSNIKDSDGEIDEKTLAQVIEDGRASATLSSDGTALTIVYTPPSSSTGTVDLKVLQNAITDGSGNKNDTLKTTATTTNSVSYDLEAPTLPQANIKMYSSSDADTRVTKVFDDNRSSLKVDFTFSEAVSNFTLDDVTLTSVNGQSALTLFNLSPSSGSSTLYTADVVGLDQAEGTFTIGVASGSYTDANGNEGAAGTSASLTIDTRAPKPFQVALDSAAMDKDGSTKIVDKTTYEKDDVIVINVVFDQALNSTVDNAGGTPTILLTIGGSSRYATLDSISGSTAKFKYTVTSSDDGSDQGIGVGSAIILTQVVEGVRVPVVENGDAKLADNIIAADDGNGASDENTATVDIGSVSQPINLNNKRVDGGDRGTGVDGYIDGAIIYADNDFSSSLTPNDKIAQADATGGFTIYGASGPLILEDGFDISTNKEFSVRYKAPYEDGTDAYQVINPVTSLVAAKYAQGKASASDGNYALSAAEAYVHTQIGDPLSSDSDLRYYNAYEEIAKSIDASNVTTDTVKTTVDNALAYQKAAASVALIVDFIATASYHARADGVTSSIKDVSDEVFGAVTTNLETFMGAFVGNSSLTSFYDTTASKNLIPTANDALWEASEGTIYTQLQAILTAVTTAMDTKLGSTFGGVDNLLTDFPDTLELLSASVVAINLAESDFTYPDSASADQDKLIEAAEFGITALTEIVQVQSVVQADILGDIASYYAGGKQAADKPTSVNFGGLVGSDEATGYLSQSVGTVVPIRYDIALDAGTAPTQFESDNAGVASEFKFVVTRAGSIKTTSSLDYVIEGNISASDIAGGQMSGEIVFDVNEKSKIVNIRLNNDTLREADETITVVISDPTETSQIVNDRASATVRDDDPSTPEITYGRTLYEATEDATVILDDAFVDYFDLDADFKLEWDVGRGSISTSLSDGTAYASGSSYVSYFELQNGLLQNLEFVASGQTGSSQSDVATLTITAVDDKDNIGRTASQDFEIAFDVNRTPAVEIDSVSGITFESATSYAGVATKISGISFSDADSDYVSVTVSADLAGTLATTSTASFAEARGAANAITFTGDKASVQDALDQLTFTATKAGNVKLTVSIDDSDPTHARNADGTLAGTATNSNVSVTQSSAHAIAASPPVLTQSFEPNLKVGANFWNSFTGISVGDLDTESLTLTLSSPDSNARFRLYDPENTSAPIIEDAASSLVLTGTANDINLKLGYLQVELTANQEGSIKAALTDGDATTTDPEPLLDYVAMDNAVPEPGGDRTITTPIDEDGGAQSISVSNIRLYDSDAFADGQLVAPTEIKILGATGGTVMKSDGTSVLDAGGSPDAISTSGGILNLQFTPDLNFYGDGKIQYVVIDPQQPTFTSSVSEIKVTVDGVNDKPILQLSSAPVIYTQGQAPVNIFNSASVTDIDNLLGYSQVSIQTNGAVATDAILMPSEIFSVTPTITGNTITFAGTTASGGTVYLSASEVSALLSSIKFENPDQYFASTQRSFDVTVTDGGGLESDVATTQLTLRDINDAPNITGGSSTQAFTEGGAGISFDGFGTIEDPEGNAIKSVTISFTSGYAQGSDTLTYSGVAVSSEFDEATGALTLTALDTQAGLSAQDFSAALADVQYQNASDNPTILSKKFSISPTDVSGATGVSTPKEITITPVNDAPSLTSVTAGVETTAAIGGQFVKGGSPVKIAANLRLKDPDSTEFKSAKVEVTASDTSPNATLTLSALGTSLQSIYGLTATFNADNTTVEISKPAGTIPRDVLESILREVRYENSGSELTGKVESISISAVDGADASSNVFTSSVNLVDIPPIEVRDVSGFDTSSDYYLATGATSAVKELKINVDTVPDPDNAGSTLNVRVFEANQFIVDLSSSLIRTEAGRFVYDRTKTNYTSNKLSDARHLDVSELDGTAGITSTTLIGSSTSNVITGSDFSDFVDGLGGRDVIRTGSGDDVVVLRIGQSDANAIYDGGAGDNDTIVLPNIVWNGSASVALTGSVDLSDTSNLASTYNVTVSNFENVDGRSATGSLVLKGDAGANTLMGGGASDIIWLGAGADAALGGEIKPAKVTKSYTATDGQREFTVEYDVGFVEVYLDGTRVAAADYSATNGTSIVLDNGATVGAKVEIIPIDDVFSIDLSSIPGTGSKILDLSKDDRIQLSLDGSSYLAFDKVNWLHKASDIAAAKLDTFDADNLDAWIELGAGGYNLVVETAQDTFKYVDIGTELYGTKGKWALNDDGTFVIKPEVNVAPKFKTLGPSSSPNNPITLAKGNGETVFSKALTSGDLISINEPADGDDGDVLILTFTSVNGVTLKSGGTEIVDGQSFSGKTPTEVNAILSGLVAELSSRGNGDVTFTIADDYAAPISKTLYFQAPNTAPTVATNLNRNSPPEAEIGAAQSLSSASLAATVGDIDTADVSGNLLSATLKVSGGAAGVATEYAKYTSINGGTVRIAYDGTTDLGEKNWLQTLEDAIEAVTFTRATIGDVTAQLSVTDGVGATAQAASDLKFTFTAKDLPTPSLIVSSVSATDTNPDLNATQYATGKARVNVKDVGAQPGDVVVFKTTVDGNEQNDVSVTIPASSSNPSEVAPFVEVSLSDLAASSLAGGTFSIKAVLKRAGGSEIEPKNALTPATFTLDTTAPDAPQIKTVSNVEGTLGAVTNEDISTILVSDPGKDRGELSHSIVQLNGISGADWYNFSSSFDIKSLLQGDGYFLNEISTTSTKITNDDESIDYQLTVGATLADGIYAVIARDSVKNTSAWDVSGFNLDSLSPEIFVVDRELDGSNIGFRLLNAGTAAGDNYELFKLSAEQSKAVELAILPKALGTSLPTDLSSVKIEVWPGAVSGEADIVAEFTRDFGASSNHWSKKDPSASHSSVSLKSDETAPVFELDFKNGLTSVTEQVGVRITVGDKAGNTFEFDVPSDQITLDASADVDGPEGLVRTLAGEEFFVHGVSATEKTEFTAQVRGLDTDVSVRSTFLLTESQLIKSLKTVSNYEKTYTADDGQTEFELVGPIASGSDLYLGDVKLVAEAYTVDGQTLTLNEAAALGTSLRVTHGAGSQFTGDIKNLSADETNYIDANGFEHISYGSGSVYLDIRTDFLASLKSKADPSKGIPSDGPGSKLEDWILIGSNDNKSEYIEFSDYLTYQGSSASDLTGIEVFTSPYVVQTAHLDFGRPALENIATKGLAPVDLSPIFPVKGQDEVMQIIHQVKDVAGNVSWRDELLNLDNETDLGSQNGLLLDNTPPPKPDIFVERADVSDTLNILQPWDVLNEFGNEKGFKFQLKTKVTGDDIIQSSVKVNGMLSSVVDGEKDIYFISREHLVDDGVDGSVLNTITFDVSELSDNVEPYSYDIKYDADHPSGQHFAVVPEIYSLAGTTDVGLNLDLYISDFTVKKFDGVSMFDGSSFEFALDIPDKFISAKSGEMVISSHPDISMEVSKFDDQTNTLYWQAISVTEFTDIYNPILTIGLTLDGTTDVLNEVAALEILEARLSEIDIPAKDDAGSLTFNLDFAELILLPSDLVI